MFSSSANRNRRLGSWCVSSSRGPLDARSFQSGKNINKRINGLNADVKAVPSPKLSRYYNFYLFFFICSHVWPSWLCIRFALRPQQMSSQKCMGRRVALFYRGPMPYLWFIASSAHARSLSPSVAWGCYVATYLFLPPSNSFGAAIWAPPSLVIRRFRRLALYVREPRRTRSNASLWMRVLAVFSDK